MNLPQWTSELTNTFVTGEDQLGVESAAQSYQQWLVPGVISTTDRARYYSFYAWVLHRFIHWNKSTRLMKDFRGSYFRHHEVAFLLANIGYNYHHLEYQFVSGLVGGGNNNIKGRNYWDAADPIPLDQDYFGNKLGGFGQYYATSMRAMGIIHEPEQAKWVYRLTHRGERLAKGYEDSIRQTAYFKKLDENGTLDQISHADALELGLVGSLNPEILAKSADAEPLRDAFFRFDQPADQNDHHRRRLTFAVVLDMVRKAEGNFTYDMLRSTLYLTEYEAGKAYIPAPELKDWFQRWQMVQLRHFFTFGLQSLWGAFLLHLRDQDYGLTLEDFIAWALTQLPTELSAKEFSAYLGQLTEEVGLAGGWQQAAPDFDQYCKQAAPQNEYALYEDARKHHADKAVLFRRGIQILAQIFLRFYPQYKAANPVWRELAEQERLPLLQYFQELDGLLNQDNFSLADWLSWIYREHILGQHEFIALQKLRYQNYDTFKFHYRDGAFHWPFATPDKYAEPIRLANLRLFNATSLLNDLGLLQIDESGLISLTVAGESHFQRVIKAEKDA